MSYRLQKWILSNTFLTHNIQVLVYGEWPNQTKNIKPFFTASYNRNEIKERVSNEESFKQYSEPSMCFKFLYVGTLSPGKQPLYAIKLVEELVKKGKRITLDVFGDGILKSDLQDYISNNKLESIVTLHGNQINNMIKRAYQVSQFLILPSKSEGWPKVVAEAMFWGCVPLSTKISCVPYMLGNGTRGRILKLDIHKDVELIEILLNNSVEYKKMSQNAAEWSRNYTIEYFDREVQKLIE